MDVGDKMMMMWMRALTIIHLRYTQICRLFKNTNALLSLDLVDFFREALGGLGFVSNYDDVYASVGFVSNHNDGDADFELGSSSTGMHFSLDVLPS